MIDKAELLKIFNDKLASSGSLDDAFLKAVWVAYKQSIADAPGSAASVPPCGGGGEIQASREFEEWINSADGRDALQWDKARHTTAKQAFFAGRVSMSMKLNPAVTALIPEEPPQVEF